MPSKPSWSTQARRCWLCARYRLHPLPDTLPLHPSHLPSHLWVFRAPCAPSQPSMEFVDSARLPTPAPHSPAVPELNSIMHFTMLLPFLPACQLLKTETHIFVPGAPISAPHAVVNTGTFLSNNLMDSEKDDQPTNKDCRLCSSGCNLSAQSLSGTSPRKWPHPPPLILAAETQESFLVPLSPSTTQPSPSSKPVHSIVSHPDHLPTLSCSPAVCSTSNDQSHICK